MSAENASRPAAKPLEELVLSELQSLRQRTGLSQGRVKRLAKAIGTLPAVEHELTKNPELTRASAAYHVIRCSVLYWIPHPDVRRLLVRTMNIDGTGPDKLITRQHTVMSEFNISVFNNYREIEKDAYGELASVLVSLRKSPCDGGRSILEDVRALAEESLRKYGQDSITIEVSAAQIVEVILRWLTNVENRQHAEDLTTALIEAVGWRAVRGRGSSPRASDTRRFWQLFGTALMSKYEDALPLGVLSANAVTYLLDPFLVYWGRMPEKDILAEEHPELLIQRSLRSRWIAPDYYRRKALSLRMVAEWLVEG